MLRFAAAGTLVALLGFATTPVHAGDALAGRPDAKADAIDGIEVIDGPLAPGASEFLESGTKLYSQHREEVVIRDFFQDRRGGVLVDVGCAYPKAFSTTYFLEHHLDWTGIGVDAFPGYAVAWARERPRSKFVSFFVTDHSGTMETFYQTTYRPVASGVKEMVEGMEYDVVKVPTSTLNDILEHNSIEKIDFLSMDIEGGQFPALRGFDIKKYRPDLVCIEDYIPDRDNIFEYFRANGYDLLEEYRRFDWVNWYFAPTNRGLRKPWEPPARDPTTSMADDGLPVGSYRQSCQNCRWEGDAVACDCSSMTGELVSARANTPCVRGFSNRDGRLTCEG